MYVVDGVTVNYERLNETVEESTVLTYQCDSELSLTGPNTITCTNAGVWSTDPWEIMCVQTTTTATTVGEYVLVLYAHFRNVSTPHENDIENTIYRRHYSNFGVNMTLFTVSHTD